MLAACRTEVCGWSRRRVLALWGSAGRWEFVVERGFGPEMGVGGRQSVERRRATASSGSGAGEYALDVPGHGDEAPLAAHFVEAAQHKLTESERRFDDAEHRLRDLLAQRVKRPACRRRQPMRHRLDRRWMLRRFRRRLEALGQRRMMRLTAHGDQRFDPRLVASRDI